MSAIRRLVEGDGTEAELALVRAAMADRPPTGEGRGRTYAALGIGTGLALGSAGAKAAGVVAKGSAWVIAKWIGLGAMVGAVSVGIVQRYGTVSTDRQGVESPLVGHEPLDVPTTSAAAATVADSTHGGVEPSAAARPSMQSTPSVNAVPSVNAGSPPVAPVAPPEPLDGGMGTTGDAPTVESLSDRHELAAQIALLDRARTALHRGDWPECIRQIATYRGRFPAGSLSPEATILHVQALLASGDRAAAARMARGFAESNPNAPLRKRILDLFAPGEIDLAGTGQWPVSTK